jgi:thiaminase
MVVSMRRDFDTLARAGGLGTAKRRELGEIFAMSSRLERGFWEMAYSLEQWPDLRIRT